MRLISSTARLTALTCMAGYGLSQPAYDLLLRVSFQFSGTADGGKMSGTVALGEYGEARWTAEKHQYRTGGGRRG